MIRFTGLKSELEGVACCRGVPTTAYIATLHNRIHLTHIVANMNSPRQRRPTVKGRFWAISLGVVFGAMATLYMLQDFELVRRIDDGSSDERRPFRVRFQPSEPLKLKPEAQARLEAMKNKEEN